MRIPWKQHKVHLKHWHWAAWERFTKSHPEATETAAQYGTKDCELGERSVEAWRGELRKMVGSRGRKAVQLSSKWQYATPLVHDLFEAWTRKSGDIDIDIPTWVEKGAPLGINVPITPRGVFPQSEKKDEEESMIDTMAQLHRGGITNYSSVEENKVDAEIEIDRLVDKGIVTRISAGDVIDEFPKGTISKLALIVKDRPDGTRKRRLIIDLRRSGGNSKAKLREKLILPRSVDAIATMKNLVHLQAEPTVEQERNLWRREMILVDVADAFPHLAVHPDELGHCVTPDLQDDAGHFLLFRAMLFGFKTAPLVWSRLAAWVARSLQSAIPVHEAQHHLLAVKREQGNNGKR